MGESGGGPSHHITHGICEECAFYFKAQEISILDFINTFPEPIIAFDWDVCAETANEAYLRLSGQPLSQIEHKMGGQLIECEASMMAGGCGRNICCTGCVARRSITRTYQTGESLTGVESIHRVRHIDGTVSDMRIQLSTEKVGNCVLVRMDKVGPA
jgi:hypothetical protein